MVSRRDHRTGSWEIGRDIGNQGRDGIWGLIWFSSWICGSGDQDIHEGRIRFKLIWANSHEGMRWSYQILKILVTVHMEIDYECKLIWLTLIIGRLDLFVGEIGKRNRNLPAEIKQFLIITLLYLYVKEDSMWNHYAFSVCVHFLKTIITMASVNVVPTMNQRKIPPLLSDLEEVTFESRIRGNSGNTSQIWGSMASIRTMDWIIQPSSMETFLLRIQPLGVSKIYSGIKGRFKYLVKFKVFLRKLGFYVEQDSTQSSLYVADYLIDMWRIPLLHHLPNSLLAFPCPIHTCFFYSETMASLSMATSSNHSDAAGINGGVRRLKMKRTVNVAEAQASQFAMTMKGRVLNPDLQADKVKGLIGFMPTVWGCEGRVQGFDLGKGYTATLHVRKKIVNTLARNGKMIKASRLTLHDFTSVAKPRPSKAGTDKGNFSRNSIALVVGEPPVKG